MYKWITKKLQKNNAPFFFSVNPQPPRNHFRIPSPDYYDRPSIAWLVNEAPRPCPCLASLARRNDSAFTRGYLSASLCDLFWPPLPRRSICSWMTRQKSTTKKFLIILIGRPNHLPFHGGRFSASADDWDGQPLLRNWIQPKERGRQKATMKFLFVWNCVDITRSRDGEEPPPGNCSVKVLISVLCHFLSLLLKLLRLNRRREKYMKLKWN